MAVSMLEAPVDVDLPDLPKGFEMVDGELVEMPEMGFQSGYLADELYFALRSWLKDHPVGIATGAECSFQCFPGRRQVRKPDAAVILCNPSTFVWPKVHCREVPALVAEVLSTSNTQENINERIEDFLSAGTKLVWVVDPMMRFALIHYPDDRILKIRESGILDGEDVLPGFRLPLAAILPPKTKE